MIRQSQQTGLEYAEVCFLNSLYFQRWADDLSVTRPRVSQLYESFAKAWEEFSWLHLFYAAQDGELQ